jgi:6-phosphogluconate dehydrogenase
VPLESYAPDTDEVVARADDFLANQVDRGQVGVVGLGKMGSGLARNLADHGWQVVAFNRTHSVARDMASERIIPAETLAELVVTLAPPRVIWLMVPAGAPVDDMLFGAATAGGVAHPGLADLLSPGDTVIDGGNSRFSEAAARAERLAHHGIHFVDCGTSGGPEGARRGACLMVGGDRSVFDELEPMLADVAAPGAYKFFPGHGAGHFVKMVHNGIEYGMMQASAEGFELLHEGPYDLDLEQVADVYQHRSVIESRLVGWLKDAYANMGDDLEGVSPVVGHSGEAAWTIEVARDEGVTVPVIEESLAARVRSETAPRYAGRVLTALREGFGGHGLGPGGGPRR